jgi:hypothetical protein
MPMRAEPGIQKHTPTPRAQAARVVVGVAAAIVLGAGPAIAWDVSTQAPRAAERRPSETASPSPWRTAGRHVKAAVGGIARVYLPLSEDAPVASEDPSASPAPARPPPRPSASVAPAMAPYVIE